MMMMMRIEFTLALNQPDKPNKNQCSYSQIINVADSTLYKYLLKQVSLVKIFSSSLSYVKKDDINIADNYST